jgi:hypothetical protein
MGNPYIDIQGQRFGRFIATNVVPCCRTCNYFKKTMLYEDFVTYLNRVSAFRRAKGASV